MDLRVDEEATEGALSFLPPCSCCFYQLTCHVCSRKTKPFRPDDRAATPPPHPAYHMTLDYYSRAITCTSMIPFPLPPPIPSPPLPLSPPSPVLSAPPPSPIRSLGYRAAMIRMRAEAAATFLSLYQYQPPPSYLPHQPDAPPTHAHNHTYFITTCIALGPRYEVGESSTAAAARPAGGLRADYGFVATMDREIRRDPERYVGYGITDSSDRSRQRAISDLLETDRGRREEMRELRAADRTRQQQIIQTLTVCNNYTERMIPLQGLSPHCMGK
ncbi:hypothetical protein Tco_0407760 [Tanacetum coccineum]